MAPGLNPGLKAICVIRDASRQKIVILKRCPVDTGVQDLSENAILKNINAQNKRARHVEPLRLYLITQEVSLTGPREDRRPYFLQLYTLLCLCGLCVFVRCILRKDQR